MHDFSLTHLANGTLLSNLAALVARERANTAQLLAHLAEVQSRRLFAPAGYPSMHEYCVHVLHFSDQAAYKRIRAARAARRFPAIFTAVAEGRLHLSAIVALSGSLTEATAPELLAAAEHKTSAEIELLLAHRFPRPDMPTRVRDLSPPAPAPMLIDELSLRTVEAPVTLEQSSRTIGTAVTQELSSGTVGTPATQQLSSRTVGSAVAQELSSRTVATPDIHQLSSRTVPPPTPRPRVTPLAPGRFGVQLTISQSTHDKLRRAKELLGFRLPPGDLEQVLDRALDALILQLEKRKLAATERPRQAQREATSRRYIPANVRRAVSKRDGDQCTFVSDDGKRCDARNGLEFDHIREAARGGVAAVANIRLRCRAHNQYTAECTFGAEFMKAKRERARSMARERAEIKARATVGTRAAPISPPPPPTS